MPHNRSNRDEPEWGEVNIHEPYEIEFWTKKFDCTPEQLIAAVKKAGISANKVIIELKKIRKR